MAPAQPSLAPRLRDSQGPAEPSPKPSAASAEPPRPMVSGGAAGSSAGDPKEAFEELCPKQPQASGEESRERRSTEDVSAELFQPVGVVAKGALGSSEGLHCTKEPQKGKTGTLACPSAGKSLTPADPPEPTAPCSKDSMGDSKKSACAKEAESTETKAAEAPAKDPLWPAEPAEPRDLEAVAVATELLRPYASPAHRCLDARSARIWLKEAAEAFAQPPHGGQGEAEDEGYLELADFFLLDVEGRRPASLLDLPDGPRRALYLHGRLRHCQEAEAKPSLDGEEGGWLGLLSLRLRGWGVWWLDPEPVLYVQVDDDRIGLKVTLELRRPSALWASCESLSRQRRLRRLVRTTDVLLFHFAERRPDAQLAEEEAKAAAPLAPIVLGEDGEEEGGEDELSLHRLLLERCGVSLAELRADPEALRFVARQLQGRHMRQLRHTPLLRQLLGAEPVARAAAADSTAPPRRTADQERPSKLCLTERVRRALQRSMPDLLGEEAGAEEPPTHAAPARTRNGMAKAVAPGGAGVQVETRKCPTTVYQALMLSYAGGARLRLRNGCFVRTLDQDALEFLKVQRMWRTEAGVWKVHGLLLQSLASPTVLGVAGDPAELVYTAQCATLKAEFVEDLVRVRVEAQPDPEVWRAEGAKEPPPLAAQPKAYRLRYRFRDDAEDLSFAYLTPEERFELQRESLGPQPCRVCRAERAKAREGRGSFDQASGTLRLDGQEWRAGDCAYLLPGTVALRHPKERSGDEEREAVKRAVDAYVRDPQGRFPEARQYQRQLEMGDFKRSHIPPYSVVRIIGVERDAEGRPEALCLGPFYRPTDLNYPEASEAADQAGFPQLFAAEEAVRLGLADWRRRLQGRCFVAAFRSEAEGRAWVRRGPERFYVTQGYRVAEAESWLEALGESERGSLADCARGAPEHAAAGEERLRCLELFCGGGGSSTGLHRAGVETTVAVDADQEAVATMRLNFPRTKVHLMDVNDFLRACMSGAPGFPSRRDFELVFGGPPCQGFSAMNRAPHTANSKRKNTCVTSQLSSYDWFRPSQAVLENVHGLLTQREGRGGARTSVCRAIVGALLSLGYQARAVQLNAGAFGVPQTRCRVFVLAAAPGQRLAETPKPLYASQLPPVMPAGSFGRPSLACASARLAGGWSAPLPELTVADAIGDLPATEDGAPLKRTPYGAAPRTWYQTELRGAERALASSVLTAHESRALSALDRLRVRHIPPSSPVLPEPGWRLMPNLPLPFEGKLLSALPYAHDPDDEDPLVRRFLCPTCPRDYHVKVGGLEGEFEGLPEPGWRLMPNLPLPFEGKLLSALPYAHDPDDEDPLVRRFLCPTCPRDYHVKVGGLEGEFEGLPEPGWRLMPNLPLPFEGKLLSALPYAHDPDDEDPLVRRFLCPTCPRDYHVKVGGLEGEFEGLPEPGWRLMPNLPLPFEGKLLSALPYAHDPDDEDPLVRRFLCPTCPRDYHVKVGGLEGEFEGLPEPGWRLMPNLPLPFEGKLLSELPYAHDPDDEDPLVRRFLCPTCPKDYHVKVGGLEGEFEGLPEPGWRLMPNLPLPFEGKLLSALPYAHDPDDEDPLVRRFLCPTCPRDYHVKVKGRARPQWKCQLPADTLIPAGLPHMSKANGWKDSYGRVSHHLWFRTITTGDGLNQQAGRILHPSQNRILTVRELARAQGFPDGWRPEGRLSAAVRQIGNAVPPPLTTALGRALREAQRSSKAAHKDTDIQML